jgi:hypothetical protein
MAVKKNRNLPARFLFTRIGSMTYYDGSERPKGGGGYNKNNIGNELCNFADFNGRLYGFASPDIGLKRVDPYCDGAGTLDDVLVIFVADQRIVGWYKHAMVHEASKKHPALVANEMTKRARRAGLKGFRPYRFRFETEVENAVLVPTRERAAQKPIPTNVKGGFGRYNVRYPYLVDGQTNISPWMRDAIEYIANYNKDNLVSNPDAENDPEELAAIAQETARGFQSDPRIRKCIENQAMDMAKKALKKRGFVNIEDTSATKPYDYTCIRARRRFFVEVKGTQTNGKTIILTRNEVEHVKANPRTCILVVVHSVTMVSKRTATGGMPEFIENWFLPENELQGIQFLWKR